MKIINLDDLADFLVEAKLNTYAGNGKEITPQRPGFKELEFKEGDYTYRDSYSGFYAAPGQEIVWYRGFPVWAMAYNGGMKVEGEHRKDERFAKEAFSFLKKALMFVERTYPFRGPPNFKEDNFEYMCHSIGDIRNFKGSESIFHGLDKIFKQDFIGGLIIHK